MFGDDIHTGKISIEEAEKGKLLENMVEFNNKTRPIKNKIRLKKEILLIV